MNPLAPVTSVVIKQDGRRSAARLTACSQLPFEQLPTVTEPAIRAKDSGRLVTDVHHAVFTSRIATAPVLLPRRLLEEVLEGFVMLVGNQVAGALPAARVVGWIAP